MTPSEPNQNPIQGEFFSANLPERFIRESVQNSPDARAGREPVAVRFTISGPNGAVPAERAARNLTGLQPHFEAVMRAKSASLSRGSERRRELEERRALLRGALPVPVVEDSGRGGFKVTSGPRRFRQEATTSGVSSGRSASLRRTRMPAAHGGLGKWVFPDASKLNAFLSVTRRAEERRFLLMEPDNAQTARAGRPEGGRMNSWMSTSRA